MQVLGTSHPIVSSMAVKYAEWLVQNEILETLETSFRKSSSAHSPPAHPQTAAHWSETLDSE